MSFLEYKDICIPIHGQITLHPLSVAIVDTPEFQRLRFIQQLGNTSFVYPGGTHSRFEHSLGVAYLARLFLYSLRLKQPELNITDEELICLEIAGLCHDLGHGPFSHVWEEFMRLAAPEPENYWKHEEASCQMLDFLIEKNRLQSKFQQWNVQDRLNFIKDLIRGIKLQNASSEQRSRYFLYEIVNNDESGLDVDKWDYFLRDAHHLGIPSNFCYKRLLDHARVIETENGTMRICFRDKTAYAIYNMFHARGVLHKMVYQHRVIGVINRMMCDALRHVSNKVRGPDGDLVDFIKVTKEYNMKEFVKLTDGFVFSLILDSTSSNKDVMLAKKILSDIFCRHLYPCFLDKSIPLEKLDFPFSNILNQEIKRDICERLTKKGVDVNPEDVAIQITAISWGKGNQNPVQKVLFFSKKEHEKAFHVSPEDVSFMLPKNYQEVRFRVMTPSKDPAIREAIENVCNNIDMQEFIPENHL